LFAAFWRRQLYSGPPRLGQTNGDRSLWRSGAVFAFPNVFHFFAHKLARLSGRRLAFPLIFARAFNRFFFWHNKMISPLATRLDVKELVSPWRRASLCSAVARTLLRVIAKECLQCWISNALSGLLKTFLTIFERFDQVIDYFVLLVHKRIVTFHAAFACLLPAK
jgi:hypothetical protein